MCIIILLEGVLCIVIVLYRWSKVGMMLVLFLFMLKFYCINRVIGIVVVVDYGLFVMIN